MTWSNDKRPFPIWQQKFLISKGLPIHPIWQSIEIKRKNECWEFLGFRNQFDYGRYRVKDGKMALAHRVAYCSYYEITLKELDKTKLFVRHRCDTPCCCNPFHLELGTAKDNNDDKIKRGRTNYAKGIRINTNILNEKDVIKIRSLYKVGNVTYKDLGEMFGVRSTTIAKIITRINWKWL